MTTEEKVMEVEERFKEDSLRRSNEVMMEFLFGDPEKAIAESKIDRIKYLKKEFDNLPNDLIRWEWMKNHQNDGIIVMLDNDDTYGFYDDDKEGFIFQFRDYIGCNFGIVCLMNAMRIKAEVV